MNRGEDTTRADGVDAPADPAQLLLLMAPSGDRSILEAWLDPQYDVRVATEASALDQAFDLCLVDGPMFGRHREALAERKRRAEPTFLPYLLVGSGREDSPENARLREHVDELVRTPIRKAELRSRLEGLLRQRELSKALAAQEKRYRRILRTIPDPVFVLDEAGVVVECNPALEADVSHEGEAVVGSALEDLEGFPEEAVTTLTALAEGTRPSVERDRTDEAAGSGSRPDASSISYRRPDGTLRTAEVAVASLRSAPAGNRGTLFVFRDVTDRIDRERVLERERERLNEFASMLAHEVRNPLNVAQGYLEEVSPGTEAEREALERVVAAQARMEQMIRELLAHARGGAIEAVQPVELRAMAETAWKATQTEAATLELDLGSETIEADPEHLQTILENLFRNAVDHAGPEVTVRVGSLEDGGFYVEDDGPGISLEEREDVFERGYTTSEAGSGLGLTLVRQMIRAHGWQIEVTESEAGGARFDVIISS